MDETASPTQVPTPIAASDQSQYWCYHCDKRVSVETLTDQPDVVCSDCKFEFVESITAPPASVTVSSPSPPFGGDPTLRSRFHQVLRLFVQVAREERVDPPYDGDFPRIENKNSEQEGEVEEEDAEYEHSVEIRNEESKDQSENEIEIDNVGESEEDMRRRRRDVLRLRLRDFATRYQREGRNRVVDWEEILRGLEDNSIEFRFEKPEADQYTVDPADYVDAAEYEALLQNLTASTEASSGTNNS